MSDKAIKADHQLVLEHGKPLIFGKNRDKGIRMNGMRPEVVQLGNGVTEKDLVVHDETNLVAGLHAGEFRAADAGADRRLLLRSRPTYDAAMNKQLEDASAEWAKAIRKSCCGGRYLDGQLGRDNLLR